MLGNANWSQCDKCPNIGYSKLLQFKGSYFIALSNDCKICYLCSNFPNKSTWTELFKFPYKIYNEYYTMTVDSITNTIYILSYRKEDKVLNIYGVVIDDEWNCEINEVYSKYHSYGMDPSYKPLQSVFINNKLHVVQNNKFGGTSRIVWNKQHNTINTNTIEINPFQINNFYSLNTIYDSYDGSLIHIPKTKKLLTLCLDDYKLIDWCLNVEKRSVWKLQHIYTDGLTNYGYILTPNEDYIIVFGGDNDINDEMSNEIYMIDINQKIISKHYNMYCPQKNTFEAVRVDIPLSMILLYGYFRISWEDKGYNEIPILSNDVSGIILNMYGLDTFIHLISKTNEAHLHYKINIESLM
eukprot:70183_1